MRNIREMQDCERQFEHARMNIHIFFYSVQAVTEVTKKPEILLASSLSYGASNVEYKESKMDSKYLLQYFHNI